MMSEIYKFGLNDAPNLTDLGLDPWSIGTAFIQQTECPLPAITFM